MSVTLTVAGKNYCGQIARGEIGQARVAIADDNRRYGIRAQQSSIFFVKSLGLLLGSPGVCLLEIGEKNEFNQNYLESPYYSVFQRESRAFSASNK